MAISSDYAEGKDESSSTAARPLLADNESSGPEVSSVPRRRVWSATRWTIVLALSVVCSNAISILTTYRPVHRSSGGCDACSQSVAEPPIGAAPILRGLPPEAQPTWISTPFYDREHSIYRGHESPETEAAWPELTQIHAGLVLVPKEETSASDIDPTKHAYFDNAEKGLVGYLVILEATHQLHCLPVRRFVRDRAVPRPAGGEVGPRPSDYAVDDYI
ncbi:hypothetical protein GGS23DRAFT_597427 [Durotheca rogersii]|uniref:uncharacterized protein n=1 Tax=Durotheca rogersii TaxID=419775 RepID=UPI00221E6583|nr:uncharacterized protein GGS23DRAFT_597427 [Durotheca rogersii]KAI5862633.1 hypothetical protein GGS23DRAFT_597427 [Durotheca rogersii]